jgi:2'-5' RNA ligase
MSEMWRLFIALELPEDVLRAIGRLQSDLKKTLGTRSARWTRLDGIHLTLKFLGDVPAGRVGEIGAGIEKAASASKPFELRAQELGCFPNLERPRVLWLGLAGDLSTLRALQADVERQIAPLGFPTEARGFSPHLTLARTAQSATRAEAAAIGVAASGHDSDELAAWRVTVLSLMRSQLRPDGAVYSRVAEAELGSRGSPGHSGG